MVETELTTTIALSRKQAKAARRVERRQWWDGLDKFPVYFVGTLALACTLLMLGTGVLIYISNSLAFVAGVAFICVWLGLTLAIYTGLLAWAKYLTD